MRGSAAVTPWLTLRQFMTYEPGMSSKPVSRRRRWDRQQGVGKALLAELLRRGAARDIYLTTIARQMGFYTRQGFAEVPLGLSTVPRLAPSMHASMGH